MAYRPQWDSGRRSNFGGSGPFDFRNWSGTVTVLVLTIGMFFIMSLLESAQMKPTANAIMDFLALKSPLPFTLESLLFPLRAVSYTLLHANFNHILGNMLFFFIFARMLEPSMGKTRLLRLYVIAAVVGAIAQVVFSELMGSTNPTIGASGAVSAIAILGALRNPKMQIWIWGIFPVPAALLVGFYFFNDVAALIGIITGEGSNVAVACHLGGAAVGFVWWKRGDVASAFIDKRQRAAVQKKHETEEPDRREMDRILAKIQAGGLNSLSDAERNFLHKRSRDLQSRR